MSSREDTTTGTRPEFAADDELVHEADVNLTNTVKMIRGDYDIPWQGIIREAVQNAADAWGENIENGILQSGATLNIDFTLDTDAGWLLIRDNAGGMTTKTLRDNLLAIDNPSAAKAQGKGGGAYGRGFWVIVASGEKVYVETKHGSEHTAATTNTDARYTLHDPSNPQLDTDGTYVFVDGLDQYDLEGNLDDWNAVERVLLKNFTFLLMHDDVRLTYTIDGTTYEPSPPNLREFKEEGTLRVEDELPTFSHRGTEYAVRDLVLVRADAVDEEPPWRGVALLKGNEYLDHPFMTLKTYTPHNIPSISTKPVEMFGWADVTPLCPDLENNAHTNLTIDLNKTGIKEVVKEVHDQHFQRQTSTSAKKKVIQTIKERANEVLSKQQDAFGDKGAKDDGPSKGKKKTRPASPTTFSLVECQADRREYDVGDTANLALVVNVPEDPECDSYDVYDIQVENQSTGELLLDRDVLTVQAKPDTPVVSTLELDLEEEGRYVFRARIRETPDILDPEKARLVAPEKDKSHRAFKVGDPEPVNDAPEPKDEAEDTASFIEDIKWVQPPSLEDNPVKASAALGEAGGFDIYLNTLRPEWQEVSKIRDDDERQTRQIELGVEWSVRAAIDHMMRDDLVDLAGDITTEGGDPLADALIDAYNQRMKQFGTLELELRQ